MVYPARVLPVNAAQPSCASFKELQVVRLKVDVSSQKGTVAKGSTGTVLEVFGNGEAFYIEFTRPVEALVSVDAGDLEPLNGVAA